MQYVTAVEHLILKDPLRPLPLYVMNVCLGALIGTMIAGAPVYAQWQKVALPAPYDTEYYLDIQFLESNPNYGWACSQERAVIRTTDGGLTWAGTMLPERFFESVMFLNPSVGYVSGPGGIYRSTDGGRSFRDVTPFQMDRTIEQGWGCFFLNELEGLYFVDGCGGLQKFFRTTDGGSSWTVFLGQVSSSGLSDGIIYRNGSGFASSSGIIWRTNDFGRTWNVFTGTGPKYWTEEITNINSTFLLPTAGNDCSGMLGKGGSLRWTSTNGSSWSEFQTGNMMFGSFLIDEQHGWGVGTGRAVYYTDNAGASWQLRNCGIEGASDDIYFINPNSGWIAGEGIYRSIFDRPPTLVTLDPPKDTIKMCEGESVLVRGSKGLVNYSWTDGVQGDQRILSNAGKYVITALDPITCFVSLDTVNIYIYPATTPKILASKPKVCFGDSVVLRAQGPYASWAWSQGSTSESITVSQAGDYVVTTVDTNGCTRVSAPYVVSIRPPVKPAIATNHPLTFCIDDSATLSAPGGFVEYLWSTGEKTKDIVVKTQGQYAVRVVDDAGCIGTSDSVFVTVLNIRNQIEVQILPGSSDIVIPDHVVGDQKCVSITIRNLSDSTMLVLREPHLLRNVFCSVPLAQLPLVIGPLGTLSLSICCSVLDTGFVYDTLEIPDTCSSSFLPVRSHGFGNFFDGISRCNVPVGAFIYRAGSSYRLSNPFPVPATGNIRLQVRATSDAAGTSALPVSANIVNTLGQIVAVANVVSFREGSEDVTNIESDIQHLIPGAYAIAVTLSNDTVLRHFPFVKAAP